MIKQFSAPLSVFLNVTNACNLRCVYCSADSGLPGPDDLSYEELCGVIDELIALKVFKVTLSGGEPFIRKDIFDLLERLIRGRISVSIISNGTLVTDTIAERLRELGIGSILVSLDDSVAETHDRTRGEGSFEKVLQGMSTLLRHGFQPSVLVTVTRLNYHRVRQIAGFLAESSVSAVSFNLLAPMGRGRCSYPTLEMSRQEMGRYADDLRHAKGEHSPLVKEDFLHWYELAQRLDQQRVRHEPGRRSAGPTLLPCGAAKTTCAIRSDGTVVPCNKLSGYSCGNLREESLRKIWHGEKMLRMRQLASCPTAEAAGCVACTYNGVCAGGCRADAFLAFGDLEAPDPHCRVLPDSAVHSYRAPREQAHGGDLVRIGA